MNTTSSRRVNHCESHCQRVYVRNCEPDVTGVAWPTDLCHLLAECSSTAQHQFEYLRVTQIPCITVVVSCVRTFQARASGVCRFEMRFARTYDTRQWIIIIYSVRGRIFVCGPTIGDAARFVASPAKFKSLSVSTTRKKGHLNVLLIVISRRNIDSRLS